MTKERQHVINKIEKAEALRDKYAQGPNNNPRLREKYAVRCARLQREYYELQIQEA